MNQVKIGQVRKPDYRFSGLDQVKNLNSRFRSNQSQVRFQADLALHMLDSMFHMLDLMFHMLNRMFLILNRMFHILYRILKGFSYKLSILYTSTAQSNRINSEFHKIEKLLSGHFFYVLCRQNLCDVDHHD